jgi:hypothetical protein
MGDNWNMTVIDRPVAKTTAPEPFYMGDRESALTYIPFPKNFTAPGAVKFYNNTGLPRPVVRTIKDPAFGKFEVLDSSRPDTWWIAEPLKVDKLIDAFKADLPVKTAWTYASITEQQWRDFNTAHPDFQRIRSACEEVPMIGFANVINTTGRSDLPTARWYFDRRHPKFASKVRADTTLAQPSIIISNNEGDINVGILQTKSRDMDRDVWGDAEGEGGTAPAGYIEMASQE